MQNKILLTLDYSGKNHETLGRLHHKIKYFIVIFLVKKYFYDNNYSLGNTTKDVYLGDDNVGFSVVSAEKQVLTLTGKTSFEYLYFQKKFSWYSALAISATEKP